MLLYDVKLNDYNLEYLYESLKEYNIDYTYNPFSMGKIAARIKYHSEISIIYYPTEEYYILCPVKIYKKGFMRPIFGLCINVNWSYGNYKFVGLLGDKEYVLKDFDQPLDFKKVEELADLQFDLLENSGD